MLLNMTIANFKSVKSPQTISFEAIKDNRLSESKVVKINEKLKAIKTSAIIGPNGAGKSSFVRATAPQYKTTIKKLLSLKIVFN